MAKERDREAKRALDRWPLRTKKLWVPPKEGGWWLRAQPVSGTASSPRLRTPGADLFKTQPDGMYLFVDPSNGYADCVCIEDCSSSNNLYNKRSRYVPASHSVVVSCTLEWLTERITSSRLRAPRWKAMGTFEREPQEGLELPVRFLRVLFSLSSRLYEEWKRNQVPTGHEYYCRHSSLKSYNSPKMQAFLRQMARDSHFYSN